MNNAELAAEALTVLWTLVSAAALWVLALLAVATLLGLALAALLIWLAHLIHPDDPET